MISIRRRMTLLVCGGIALLLLVGGFVLYWTIRAVLTTQFDATLAAKAQALIVAADWDDQDLEIDLNVQEFAGFGSRRAEISLRCSERTAGRWKNLPPWAPTI